MNWTWTLNKFCNCHHTILGRMGLLVLLYLIQINLYKEVDAPPKRGFSSIEIWFLGIQIPILVAILEYGIILALRKVWQSKDYKFFSVVDLCTFCLSVAYLIIFNGIYWLSWNTNSVNCKNTNHYFSLYLSKIWLI